MPTARQLKALIESFASGDDERFYASALQVAAHEARRGHGKLAIQLRELIDDARRQRPACREKLSKPPTPISRPKGPLEGLIQSRYPDEDLREMVLPSQLGTRLKRVVREQRAAEKLFENGLAPRSKLLLLGPPGSGKTLTARALAGSLRLPLFSIQLDGLLTRFLGESAAKLRLIFEAMAETRGVYLFDEFDAIGGERASPNDVGEIRRVLNSFLQFIEEAAPTSLVVAASNHPNLLDPALFRRFDDVLQYDLPDQKLVRQTLELRLQRFSLKGIDWPSLLDAGVGLSYADLTQACADAAKTALLDGLPAPTTGLLLQALKERRELRDSKPPSA